MTKKSSLEAVEVEFDDSALTFRHASYLFDNSNEVNCPLNNCTLYTEDCKEKLDSTSPIMLSPNNLSIIIK